MEERGKLFRLFRYAPLPKVTEHVPLHSESPCKNISRVAGGGGAIKKHIKLGGGEVAQTEKIRKECYVWIFSVSAPSLVGADLFFFGPQCLYDPQLQIICCYIARYYVRK